MEDFSSHLEHNDSDLVLFKVARLLDNEKVNFKNTVFNFQYQFKGENFNDFSFDLNEIKMHVLSGSFKYFTKLYKKELFEKIDKKYFLIDNHFDYILLHLQMMKNAEKISFINAYLYYYFFNYWSLGYDYSYDNQDIFEISQMVEKYLNDSGDMEELNHEFILFKIKNFLKYMDSQDYYDRARGEFSKIELKEDIDEELLKRFNFVLENESYEDYKKFDSELLLPKLKSICEELKPKFEELEQKHDNLKNKCEETKSLNENMLNSTSWKVSKPFRKLRRLLNNWRGCYG